MYFKSNINIKKVHKGSTYGIRVIGFVPKEYYSFSVHRESYGVCQIQTILIQLKWLRFFNLNMAPMVRIYYKARLVEIVLTGICEARHCERGCHISL